MAIHLKSKWFVLKEVNLEHALIATVSSSSSKLIKGRRPLVLQTYI